MSKLKFVKGRFPFDIKSFKINPRRNNCKIFDHHLVEELRNIGIVASRSAGKTTLRNKMRLCAGPSSGGEVASGPGSELIFDEIDKHQGATYRTSVSNTIWNGFTINVLDTPGHAEFSTETYRSLGVVDGAVLVLCAATGGQCQTCTLHKQMSRYHLPCVAFVNKMDLANSNLDKAVYDLRYKMNENACPLQMPLNVRGDFKGVVDLVEERAIYFKGNFGADFIYDEIPVENRREAVERRQEMLESLSAADRFLNERKNTEGFISTEALKDSIRRSCKKGTFVPVLIGSALKNLGITLLLEAIVDYLPHPGEIKNHAFIEQDKGVGGVRKQLLNSERGSRDAFVGLAFKLESGRFGQLVYLRSYQGSLKKGDHIYNSRTKAQNCVSKLFRLHANMAEDINVVHAGDIFASAGFDCLPGDTFTSSPDANITMRSFNVPEPIICKTIKSSHSQDRASLNRALTRFSKEDPSFRVVHHDNKQEAYLFGMGELHLELCNRRIEKEFGCSMVLGKPKVAFRETLVETCPFDYIHKRNNGLTGQFARVIGVMEPLPANKKDSVEFSDEIEGYRLPKAMVPEIERGFRYILESGRLSLHILSGIKFRLLDAVYHNGDSDNLAFMLAAQGAVKQVYENGSWETIEPIMLVEIWAPKAYNAQVCTEVLKRQAVIKSFEVLEDTFTILAEIPLNKMFGFAEELGYCTRRHGEFTMVLSHYIPIEHDLKEKTFQNNQGEDLVLKQRNKTI